MGGPDFFGIRIDAEDVYFCGQTVTGKVILQTNEELTNIKTVTVKLKGEGDVHWEERKTRRRDGETETYTEYYDNSEVYIKTKHLLHSGNVNRGNHSYQFSFQLPSNLPCSFEGKYGNVRYRIEAKLDRKGFFTFDKKTKQFITVNALVDLNKMPSIKEPVTRSNSKTFGCLCCTSGPLSSTVNLPRTGFAPGETILINAEIENLSNKEMTKTQAILIQKVVFHSDDRETKEIERHIQEIRKGKIEEGGSESWEGVEIRVPSVPPTGLGGSCSIISLTYELEFRVDPSGIGFDLVTTIPIRIGTIPLRAVFQSWPSYTGSPVQTNQPIDNSEDFSSSTYSVKITRGSDGKFGLKYTGNKITGVTPGGPADVVGEIVPGDLIIRVNNNKISEGNTTKEVGCLIQESGTSLCLEIKRGGLVGAVPPICPPAAASYVPPSAPPIPLEGFDDLPPPTYEQAISADEDGNPTTMKRDKDSGEGVEGNWDYHPVYPIWPSAPPQPPR